MTAPVRGAPTMNCQSAAAGGLNDRVASCRARMSLATRASSSSPWLASPPGTKLRISTPSSIPRGWGDAANPTASRCASSACTAGVHSPADRRIVSPRRSTSVSPPPSLISDRGCCNTTYRPASGLTPQPYGALAVVVADRHGGDGLLLLQAEHRLDVELPHHVHVRPWVVSPRRRKRVPKPIAGGTLSRPVVEEAVVDHDQPYVGTGIRVL